MKRIEIPRKCTRETLVDSARLVGFNFGADQVAEQLCSPHPRTESNVAICRAPHLIQFTICRQPGAAAEGALYV